MIIILTHLHPLALAHEHDALIKALEIHLILGLLELIRVFRGLDVQALAHGHGRGRPVPLEL